MTDAQDPFAQIAARNKSPLEAIYAYTAVNAHGGEDVVFVIDGNGRIIPLVCKTREEADMLSPIAEQFRVSTGIAPVLYKFTNKEKVSSTSPA